MPSPLKKAIVLTIIYVITARNYTNVLPDLIKKMLMVKPNEPMGEKTTNLSLEIFSPNATPVFHI